MIRTQIQLPEAEYDELRSVAARHRRSMADCIREGIRLFLRSQRHGGSALDEIAGKFRALSTSDLKEHDRSLADAIQDSKRSESPE